MPSLLSVVLALSCSHYAAGDRDMSLSSKVRGGAIPPDDGDVPLGMQDDDLGNLGSGSTMPVDGSQLGSGAAMPDGEDEDSRGSSPGSPMMDPMDMFNHFNEGTPDHREEGTSDHLDSSREAEFQNDEREMDDQIENEQRLEQDNADSEDRSPETDELGPGRPLVGAIQDWGSVGPGAIMPPLPSSNSRGAERDSDETDEEAAQATEFGKQFYGNILGVVKNIETQMDRASSAVSPLDGDSKKIISSSQRYHRDITGLNSGLKTFQMGVNNFRTVTANRHGKATADIKENVKKGLEAGLAQLPDRPN